MVDNMKWFCLLFQVPRHVWPEGKEVSGCPLDDYLKKYQNPVEADPMMKVQNELDETKIVLHNTIEAVLQRGEKLDDLVAKSEGLSMQSKTFYKTAKKTNACCSSWSWFSFILIIILCFSKTLCQMKIIFLSFFSTTMM